MVNKTIVGGALALLGCSLLVIGAWQLNQWQVMQAQANSSLEMLKGMSALATEAGTSLGGADTAAAQALASATGAYLWTGIADLIVGLALLAGGLLTYPVAQRA